MARPIASAISPAPPALPRQSTCAFVPLKPNELTPAIRRPFAAAGHCRSPLQPPPEARPMGCADWASRSADARGISACCSASTTLIRPATPAAASRWPMFVLTEPISSGSLDASLRSEHRAERLNLDRIAERRAGAVRLDVADYRRALTPRIGQRVLQQPPAAPVRSAR